MKIDMTRKLVVFFLLVSMVPLAAAGVVAYRQSADAIREMILERLDTLAVERADRIERMITERRSDVAALAQVPSLRTATADFTQAFATDGLDSAAYRTVENRYAPFLAVFGDKQNMADLLLISAAGDVVFSLSRANDLGTNLHTGRYRNSELAAVFDRVAREKTPTVSDVCIYEPSNSPAIFLAAPVQAGDRSIGVVAFRMPMQPVDAVAGDYAGLGETGETSIVQTRGDDTLWVAPTRHDSGAAFTRRLGRNAGRAIPAIDAGHGKSGHGTYPDYRGVAVLAAWRHIPMLRLGLVIKMDEVEALAPTRALMSEAIWLGLVTVLGVLAVSFLIARSLSRPIVALTRAADRLAAGDPSVRTDIRTGDEIGALGSAFNDMAAALEQNLQASEETVWLKTGLTRLNAAMSGVSGVDKLASTVISELSKTLDAQVGAFYLIDDGEKPALTLQGSYAYRRRKNLSNTFAPGEGLVGQAALEKQQILIRNVPEDYISVASGLGEHPPRFICVTPFLYEGRVKGVVEIGTLAEISDIQMEYLGQALGAVAVAVESAQGKTRLTRALEESRQLTEKLQVQQEELRSTNEELEEQTQRLSMSEDRLKAQQEELQVTNEELEEKNDLLERQKREVEQARTAIAGKAEELALSSRYKSEFLANMSHELRTPLNSLLLLAQGLARNKQGNLTAEQVESAEIVYSSGNDLLNLINNILDLSKIEAGRTEFQFGRLKVSDLAEGVRACFGHMAADKGLSLEVAADGDAPDQITSDRQRVEQIIRNLVSNAVKFTEQGGVTVRFGRPDPGIDFSRSGVDRRQCLAIAVSDTGIGIATAQQKIIFEAFQQADGGTARKYGGTGLGLSIARELTRLLGGDIQVRSEPGKGSTFTLYLPVEPADRKTAAGKGKQEAPPRPESAATQPAVPIPDPRVPSSVADDRDSVSPSDRAILVVEDDPQFAKILLDQCHQKGFKCLVAPTGEAGLELAAKYLPGAVILDIRLPGIDGWTVLKTLKEDIRTRHIPVHVVSVEASSTDSLRRGAVGHAVKPLSQESLEETFRRLDQVSAGKPKRVLVVEDDPNLRRETARLIGDRDITVVEAGSAAEAMAALRAGRYDCMVLDLGLPDMGGDALLSTLEGEGMVLPPVIVNTARDLTMDEEMMLREHADAIVIKDVRSQERLLDEVSLFLHRIVSRMPDDQRRIIQDLYDTDALLKGKKVLVVDDDMRTTFAVSRLLAERGMTPLKADNGERALALLDEQPDVDMVLMDIMMPVMDGYATMQRIRGQDRFARLPIIALTAKAMPEDREKCLACGANDYLAKPVDAARLISMMRVWLYR